MADVLWTMRAITELESIRAYVTGYAPLAAKRLADRIVSTAESLASYPERGRPLSGGRRELLVVPPYRIRYRVKGDAIEVLSVWHGRRLDSD